MKSHLSMLYSQLGYYTNGPKQAFFRASDDVPANAADGMTFELKNPDQTTRYTGKVHYWGNIWRSQWWVMDFTDFPENGIFSLHAGEGKSEFFKIGNDVLSSQGLRAIALDQLDERRIPGVGGFRDCGSEIRELSSMVITVHALVDLWENTELLPHDRRRIIENLIIGAQAIVASQEHWPNDPERDGRFNHDAFRMTEYGTTDYHNWHDTAYAITGLVRAAKALAAYSPTDARACMNAAVLGFQNSMRRPYQLESDFNSRTHPNIPYDDDFGDFVHVLGARAYNQPDDWKLPRTLRTKDKMTFTWACTLLYEATGGREYLDAAVTFASSICERQCLDPSKADGFGFFYEFEEYDDIYMLEFGHNHKFHMGNIEPCNLAGLMALTRILPESPYTARWQRAIYAYVNYYVKRVTALTPLSIYPQSVYAGPEGGVRFFEMAVHGFTCLYGQIARNLMELSAYTSDGQLAALAEQNLMFAVGRNPGFPNRYDADEWRCTSLAKGVGSHSFGGVHSLSDIPSGSVMNGFCTLQFNAEKRLGDNPDEPGGIIKPDGEYYFNEDYLPHSHGYVSGVAMRERLFTLDIRVLGVTDGQFTLTWDDGSEGLTQPFGADRRFVMRSDKFYKKGTLALEAGDARINRHFTVIPGRNMCDTIDMKKAVRVEASAPDNIKAGETFEISMGVINEGIMAVCDTIMLCAAGITLDTNDIVIELAPGESAIFSLRAKASNMPGVFLLNYPRAYGVPEILAGGKIT